MQQPGSGSIIKPHKVEEQCGLFRSKPKLFATYEVNISFFLSPVKKRRDPEFPRFLGNIVVHERNLDTWEFEKGALSELRFCGVAVLQCCGQGKAKEV